MRILLVGAGAVGRSIATELLSHGHEVTLVDDDPDAIRVALVPDADWVLADACSPSSLEEVGARDADAVVAVTGDDKVNLVVSLLAKTVFAVPKVIARANHSSNEWMYNANWGVDVIASTPRALTALVEEAVAVGEAVQLLSLDQTSTSIYTIQVPSDSPQLGSEVADIEWPAELIIGAVVRNKVPLKPGESGPIQADDEIIVITGRGNQIALHELEDLLTLS